MPPDTEPVSPALTLLTQRPSRETPAHTGPHIVTYHPAQSRTVTSCWPPMPNSWWTILQPRWYQLHSSGRCHTLSPYVPGHSAASMALLSLWLEGPPLTRGSTLGTREVQFLAGSHVPFRLLAGGLRSGSSCWPLCYPHSVTDDEWWVFSHLTTFGGCPPCKQSAKTFVT